MRQVSISFLALLILAQLAFGGSISGTVTNATSVDGMFLVVAMLHAGITDLTSAPMTYIFSPEYMQDYTLTNDAIVDFNPFFPIAYMPAGILPASGDPFGAQLFPPVITWGGVATDVDITLFSSGYIGGNINYTGSYAQVCVNVYDYYSILSPTLESTHFIGADNYLLSVIPSGPKQVQAFDDLNGNRIFDDGEPSGYYSIPFLGFDIVLVTGNISTSGINITIDPTGIGETRNLPDNSSLDIYPNPFNSTVTIAVGAGFTPASFEVFDINGKIIEEIPHVHLNKGSSGGSFTWTPDESVGSGVYFVRASVGDENITKQVIYLK